MRIPAIVVVLVLVVACSKNDGATSGQVQGAGPDQSSPHAAPAVVAAPVPDHPGAATSSPSEASPGQLRRVVAVAKTAKLAAAPKGLYAPLLKQGNRWELIDAEGRNLVAEVSKVHAVGQARVVDLTWAEVNPHEGCEVHIERGPLPGYLVVSDAGLWVGYHKDAALPQLLAGEPHYADPPRLDRGSGDRYARIIDDMVCLGFDTGAEPVDVGELCHGRRCPWRLCLRPGEIVGVDTARSSTIAPPRFTVVEEPSGAVDAMVTASSEHARWRDYQFTARHLHDGRRTTSWQPAKGKAVGEWVEFAEIDPVPVDAMVIANGFQRVDKLGDLFAGNARVRTATISFDGKPELEVELPADERGYLVVELGGKQASRVRFTINAIWPGAKWQDVAISEMWVE